MSGKIKKQLRKNKKAQLADHEGARKKKKKSKGEPAPPKKPQSLTGVLQGNRKGFAFLRPDQEKEADVFIPPDNVGGALHGDRVLIELAAGGKGKRREGEVMKILEKGTSRITGTVYQEKGKKWVLPDEYRFYQPVKISSKGKIKAQVGDKVVVEINRESQDRGLKGTLIEVLGRAGDPGVDMASIMKKYSLSPSFPTPVENQVSKLVEGENISEAAYREQRRDLREQLIIAVDPEGAQDMDDAISLEVRQDGGYTLGVHIADVGHYVREGSHLYREALNRGTSVYLVDRVIHMLPTHLSQGLCSLREGEDRLALSVEIELDSQGKVEGYRFFHSILEVTACLAYGQVEKALQGQEKFDPSLQGMVEEMDQLARILKEKRVSQGALDMEIPEPEIKLDEEGRPLSVTCKETGRSESIIEEFMLMANQAVAEYMYRKDLPIMYRIHPRPEKEKMITFRNILSLWNLKIPGNPEKITPLKLQEIISRVKGEPQERTVNYLLLRSLSQARYSAFMDEHFGLATDCYTHFTSPIRRFPDLWNHRVLSRHLRGELNREQVERFQEQLPEVAERCSQRERKALEAERESQDLKKVEYMLGQEGEEYQGSISGITSFGFFVELDNTVEGLVALSDMTDDYYVFREDLMMLEGKQRGERYCLGDRVNVMVNRVSLEERIINFLLV